MKKILSLAFCLFFTFTLCAQSQKYTALELKNAALEKENAADSIQFISDNLSNTASPADRRSSLYFLGTLQEQSGLYSEASLSYAKAAGISAGDASGMKKITAEQLVLCAVRASLNSGDWETAELYLNSAVRSSKNENVLALVNLYSVWAELIKAQNIENTKDSIELLKAYSSMSSMKSVKEKILLTLW